MLTRGLLRKDADWLLLFAATGLIVQTTVLLGQSFQRAWLNLAHSAYQELLWVWWLVAPLLGFFAAVRESLYGTEDYLQHRPISAARLFWTRAVAIAATVATWAWLPPLIAGIAATATIDGSAAVVWPRVADYGLLGSVALATAAAGHLAGSLPTHWLLRLLALGVLAPLVMATATITLESAGIATYTVGMLVCAVWMTLGAQRLQRHAGDRDRPLPAGPLALAGLPLAAAAVGVVSFAVNQVQEDAMQWTMRGLQRVVLTEDGRVTTARIDSGPQREVWRQVEDGGVLSVQDAPWPTEFWGMAYARDPIDDRCDRPEPRVSLFDGWIGEDGASVFVRDRSRGAITAIAPDGGWVGPLDGLVSWYAVTVIGDRGNGRLWALLNIPHPYAAPQLVPVELDDRYLGPETERNGTAWFQDVRVRGERGIYTVHQIEGGVTATPAETNDVATAQADVRPAMKVRVLDRAPLGATVIAEAPDGSSLRHEHRLRSAGDWLRATPLFAATALRPPLLGALSCALPPRVRGSRYGGLFDVVLTGGFYPWLALLPLAIGVWLAIGTHRRARALAMPAARRRAWVGGTLLLGLPGWLAFRLLEPARAWRRAPAQATDAPSPLIVTAPPTAARVGP